MSSGTGSRCCLGGPGWPVCPPRQCQHVSTRFGPGRAGALRRRGPGSEAGKPPAGHDPLCTAAAWEFVRTGFRAAGSWLWRASPFGPSGHAVPNPSPGHRLPQRATHSVTCEQDTHGMPVLGREATQV